MHIFRKYWCFLLSSLITCLSGIVVVISVRFLQCILPGQQVVLGLIRGRLSNVLKLHREVEPLICLWVKHNRNRPSKLFQSLVLKIPPRYVSIFSRNSNGLHIYNVSQPELQPQINSQNNLN
jgi:hypothetical protein